MLTATYKLDLVPGGIPLVIPVSQYDVNSRVFSLELTSSGGEVSIPISASAAIRGTKPDGNGFDYAASGITISGDTVTVRITITAQMTAVAGRVPCEIYLYTGTPPTTANPDGVNYVQLATANFILQVEPAALDKDTLKSDSEVRQLVDVIDRTDELLDAAADIETAYADYSNKAVFYAEAQTLTDAQKATARENIGAADDDDVAELENTVNAELAGKVNVVQGSAQAGKALIVGDDGNVTTGEAGIPEAVKDALIEIMRHVAYVDDDGQTYLTNLIVALGRGDYAYWTVDNRMTHAVNSNGVAVVIRGMRYTATITGEAGYTLDSVTVTMGGTDVTSSVYANGVITIPAVTGNVVITAIGSKHYTFLGNYVNDLYSTGGNQEIRLHAKQSRAAAVGTSGEIREISYDGSTSQYYYAFKIPSGAHTIQFDDGFGSEHQYLYGCMIARVNGDRIIKVDTSGSNIGNTFEQTDISDYNDGTLYAVINIFKWDGNWRADGRPNIDGNADLSNVDISNWRVIIE